MTKRWLSIVALVILLALALGGFALPHVASFWTTTIGLGGPSASTLTAPGGVVNVNSVNGVNLNISGSPYVACTTTQCGFTTISATGTVNGGSGFLYGGSGGTIGYVLRSDGTNYKGAQLDFYDLNFQTNTFDFSATSVGASSCVTGSDQFTGNPPKGVFVLAAAPTPAGLIPTVTTHNVSGSQYVNMTLCNVTGGSLTGPIYTVLHLRPF